MRDRIVLAFYEAASQKTMAGEGKAQILLDCLTAHLSLFLTEVIFICNEQFQLHRTVTVGFLCQSSVQQQSMLFKDICCSGRGRFSKTRHFSSVGFEIHKCLVSLTFATFALYFLTLFLFCTCAIIIIPVERFLLNSKVRRESYMLPLCSAVYQMLGKNSAGEGEFLLCFHYCNTRHINHLQYNLASSH